MPYVDRVLEPGEVVRYRTSVSWMVYLPAIVLALAAIATPVLTAGHPELAQVSGLATLLFGAAAVIAFVPAWLRRLTTEIAVTDRRIILKRGLIRRHTVEMNMQKVESVDVDQTLAGRLFDYGNVTIRGTGSSLEKLTLIDAPLKLRSKVTAG
jgi:membrane protein YdbS with pleckstrin-like domain